MPETSTEYVSYLLRLWKSNDADRVTWRVSLEHTLTGERHAFGTLDALCAFLQGLEQQSVRPAPEDTSPSPADKP